MINPIVYHSPLPPMLPTAAPMQPFYPGDPMPTVPGESMPTVPEAPTQPLYPAAPMPHINPGSPMPTVPTAPMPNIVPSAPMQPFVPRHAQIRHEPGISVYVRGLADEFCDCRLREVFQSYGSIVQAKVIL